jgi:V/A-type H+-transporting ATPase subunit I
MAIDPVKRVYILAHRSFEGALLARLQDLGLVELSRLPDRGTSAPPAEAEPADERTAGLIRKALGILGRHLPPRGMLDGGPRRVRLGRGELDTLASGDFLETTLAEVFAPDARLADIQNRRTRLQSERRELAPWASLGVDPAALPGTNVVCRCGRVPAGRWAAIEAALAGIAAEISVHPQGVDTTGQRVVIFARRAAAAPLDEILKHHEWKPLELPPSGGAPAEVLARIETELARLDRDEADARERLGALAGHAPRLMVLGDHFASLAVRERAQRLVERTRDAVCLTGWVAARDAQRIEEELRRHFPEIEVLVAEPEENAQVPVILRNQPLAEPFETIVDLYGRPVYGGFDPSPILAFFFAAFFGFCMTDAGYGLVLMAVTWFMLARGGTDMPPAKKKFLQLFFLGGVATVILGAVVGGWFGVTVSWKLFDPLEDLFVFFGLAIALGLAHLLTGLGIKMVRTIRSGDWVSGLCDQGLWMLIIAALTILGLAAGGTIPPVWKGIGAYLSMASGLGIVFFQGRQADRAAGRFNRAVGAAYQLLWVVLTVSLAAAWIGMGLPASGWAASLAGLGILALGWRSVGGILARVGLGLYSLYGISGYLGDTLSYSRLVALGLTTGIVGMIVNTMAGIAKEMPYIGWPVALGILVGGHIFNLVINLLGAFVHSCRLQYVEFFTKFYEAGGRAFKPFSRVERHSIVND